MLSNLVDNLKGMIVSVFSKFLTIGIRQAQINNDRRAEGDPELTYEAFVDQLQLLIKEHLKTEDFAQRIELFKSSVSPETWDDIKNNPAIEDMVNAHYESVVIGRIDLCVHILLDNMKEANSEQSDPLIFSELKSLILDTARAL